MQQAKQKVDFNVLWKVIAMAKPYNRLFVTCMVLAVLLAPISSFLPYIVKTIVDEYIVANDFNGLLLMCGLFLWFCWPTSSCATTFFSVGRAGTKCAPRSEG